MWRRETGIRVKLEARGAQKKPQYNNSWSIGEKESEPSKLKRQIQRLLWCKGKEIHFHSRIGFTCSAICGITCHIYGGLERR